MSISDIGNTLSQQYFLGVLRQRLNETSNQSSSGKKSTTIAGLGTNAVSSAISYRSESKLLDSYTANLNTAKTRVSVTDTALSSITSAARDLAANLRSQLQDTTPSATLLSNTAKASLQNVVDKLNTQVDGRYIFSGQNFDSKAFDNLSGLNTNMAAVVTAAMASGTTTAASATTAAQAVTGTALGTSGAAASGGTVNIKVDTSTSLSLGLRSTDSGFSDVLRGMAMIANLPQPTTAAEQKNYWSIVNSAIGLLEGGAKSVDNSQAVVGDQAKTIDTLLTQHSETQSHLEDYIGSVEDIDMAEAATKFSALQTQLQTSYSIVASLKDLSLVKYL